MALGFELFSLKALRRVPSIFCLLSCVVVCQSNGHGPVTVPPPITHSPPHGGGSSAHAMQMDMSPFLQSGGIFPNLAATAASGPKRSECGIGALFPWADNLYMVSYLSVPGAGSGTGFYSINKDMNMTKLANHSSTYANRLLHPHSNQAIIGAWAVDMEGKVKTFDSLLHVRVGGMALHLTDPEHKVYMLGMDGPLWECDVYDMNCTQLFDLVKELAIPTSSGEQVHFKAAHSMNGRLVVASNTEEEDDFLGTAHGGRLAEWQGPGHEWTILARTAFAEVAGRGNFGKVIYALGWDAKSLLFMTYVGKFAAHILQSMTLLRMGIRKGSNYSVLC
eukprot:scpid90700/ scgid25367/ 